MLLATTCPVCGASGSAPCRRCTEALRPPPDLAPPPGLDACLALVSYEGSGRELVARLKYANHRQALPGLAAAMASLVTGSFDVITWAPTTPARRRERGFDHAELLARALGRRLRLPVRRLLDRGPGAAQTGLGLADRRCSPDFGSRRRSPRSVILVDDVVTSGSTLSSAAGALRAAGAERIVGLVAARTPPPGG